MNALQALHKKEVEFKHGELTPLTCKKGTGQMKKKTAGGFYFFDIP